VWGDVNSRRGGSLRHAFPFCTFVSRLADLVSVEAALIGRHPSAVREIA